MSEPVEPSFIEVTTKAYDLLDQGVINLDRARLYVDLAAAIAANNQAKAKIGTNYQWRLQ